MNESRDIRIRKNSRWHLLYISALETVTFIWDVTERDFLSMCGDLCKYHRQSIPVLTIISYCDFLAYSWPQKILTQWIPVVVKAESVLRCVHITELVWNFVSNTLLFRIYSLFCIFKMANNFLFGSEAQLLSAEPKSHESIQSYP